MPWWLNPWRSRQIWHRDALSIRRLADERAKMIADLQSVVLAQRNDISRLNLDVSFRMIELQGREREIRDLTDRLEGQSQPRDNLGRYLPKPNLFTSTAVQSDDHRTQLSG